MAETACFLTVKRNDLIDMTNRLIGAIESGFFHDSYRPLLFSMTGSVQSGKSLVVDIACDLLCGDKRIVDINCMTTRWQGQHGGMPIEVNMMDVVGWNPYEYRTLRDRKTGGINFLQNAPHLDKEADIAICIEALGAKPSNYPELQQHRFRQSIEAVQARGMLSDCFARFVSVRVNNQTLLNSPSFRACFDAFAPQTGVIAAAKVWKDTDETLTDITRAVKALPEIFCDRVRPLKTDKLPVYGYNFPKPFFSP